MACEDDEAQYEDVVGGLPHLPPTDTDRRTLHTANSHSPALLSWPICSLCHIPMLFLLKLHSPSESGGSSRLLLFFCCSDETCEAQQAAQKQPTSRWRVWRLIQEISHSQPITASITSTTTQRQQQRVESEERDERGDASQRLQETDSTETDWGSGGDWDRAPNEAHGDSGSGDSRGRSESHGNSEADADDELSARLEALIVHRQQLAHSAQSQATQLQQQQQVGAAASRATSQVHSTSTHSPVIPQPETAFVVNARDTPSHDSDNHTESASPSSSLLSTCVALPLCSSVLSLLDRRCGAVELGPCSERPG